MVIGNLHDDIYVYACNLCGNSVLVLKNFSIVVIKVSIYEILDQGDPTSDYQSKNDFTSKQGLCWIIFLQPL